MLRFGECETYRSALRCAYCVEQRHIGSRLHLSYRNIIGIEIMFDVGQGRDCLIKVLAGRGTSQSAVESLSPPVGGVCLSHHGSRGHGRMISQWSSSKCKFQPPDRVVCLHFQSTASISYT